MRHGLKDTALAVALFPLVLVLGVVCTAGVLVLRVVGWQPPPERPDPR